MKTSLMIPAHFEDVVVLSCAISGTAVVNMAAFFVKKNHACLGFNSLQRRGIVFIGVPS